jgi:hypothetical protein
VSSWGTPRGNGCTSVVGVWAAGLAFVAATTLFAVACENVDDGTTPRDCGETSAHCDGQTP